MPKISIVITSYNYAQYLPDAIESAYNQTLSPHEIIIVDDGSTDNSLQIAEQYMFKELPLIESPVRVISQVNKGLPSARNTGIMNATGDYILFLDADDMLTENAVEKLASKALETNADIIAPSFRCFGKYNQDVVIGPFNIEDFKKANRIGYFSLVRRSALLEIGGYSPKMKWGYEDYHLWFNLFSRQKSLAFMQEVLVHYRTKDNSMIQSAQAHHLELMEQIRTDFPNIWPK